ncbi:MULTISPECIES: helix-turn-helix domain-containing protein [Bacillaceae]|uniref:helix-turn-helix domain-containing protein n=1 Tax=Bacillaceae TaxID=186817 RepID=UPI002079AF9D|nr:MULTISPECIES: helix-turn-helix domain-containing protein [Bacillaceae]MED3994625.1 helix-turn-helix domain-containing protein [Peribacillus frigoritolerans]USL11082.1 helix-turn-helix domain-containing protein [Bacillus bombysepticus]
MEHLILNAISGHEDSKQKLIERFNPLIINYAKTMNHMELEDAIQELNIVFLQALDKFEIRR